MNNNICSLHHVSLIVSDTDKSLEFYCGILGLERVERPDLGFPGAWLQVGDQHIHLLELPNPDSTDNRPLHGGRDRHTAFSVQGLDLLRQRLHEAGIDYSMSQSGRKALFCRDPDANAVELIAG
jgi:glyoxylase I family protein